MKPQYDVLVVGAGPAGAQCARHLVKNSNLSVLLIDSTQEIGEPKKSTAGTFDDCIREFSLPDKVIMHRVKKTVLEGPTNNVTFPVDGAVLDFGALKKFLVEDAVRHGLDISISTRATHPIIEEGKITGIQYHSLEGDGRIDATVVVDATGPSAILAQQAGLRQLDPESHWVGMEFEMDNVSAEDSMLFKFDQNIAPGGYAWIFSTGIDSAKIGLCWSNKFFKKMGGSGSLASYLFHWLHTDPRLKNAKGIEIHGGDAYFNPKPLQKVTDGLVCVGDTVCTINPIGGEGIRPGMKSGRFAAETIIEAFETGDLSEKKLREYEKRWNEYAKIWRISGKVSDKIYTLNNDHLDTFISRMNRLEKDAIKKFLSFDMSAMDVLKIVKDLV